MTVNLVVLESFHHQQSILSPLQQRSSLVAIDCRLFRTHRLIVLQASIDFSEESVEAKRTAIVTLDELSSNRCDSRWINLRIDGELVWKWLQMVHQILKRFMNEDLSNNNLNWKWTDKSSEEIFLIGLKVIIVVETVRPSDSHLFDRCLSSRNLPSWPTWEMWRERKRKVTRCLSFTTLRQLLQKVSLRRWRAVNQHQQCLCMIFLRICNAVS